MAISELRTKFGPIPAKVNTTYHIDYYDLAKIMEKVYGTYIEIGTNNGFNFSADIQKEEDEDDSETIQECVDSSFMEDYHLNMFMTDLVNKDIIPAGHYVVNNSW